METHSETHSQARPWCKCLQFVKTVLFASLVSLTYPQARFSPTMNFLHNSTSETTANSNAFLFRGETTEERDHAVTWFETRGHPQHAPESSPELDDDMAMVSNVHSGVCNRLLTLFLSWSQDVDSDDAAGTGGNSHWQEGMMSTLQTSLRRRNRKG